MNDTLPNPRRRQTSSSLLGPLVTFGALALLLVPRLVTSRYARPVVPASVCTVLVIAGVVWWIAQPRMRRVETIACRQHGVTPRQLFVKYNRRAMRQWRTWWVTILGALIGAAIGAAWGLVDGIKGDKLLGTILATCGVAMWLSLELACRINTYRLVRALAGYCYGCDYDLRGTTSDCCPECGRFIKPLLLEP